METEKRTLERWREEGQHFDYVGLRSPDGTLTVYDPDEDIESLARGLLPPWIRGCDD